MENIHPAAIKPKVNKRRYMNIIREKYSKLEKKMKGGDEETVINNEIQVVENGGTDYRYVGALATMVGEIGLILYWFIMS